MNQFSFYWISSFVYFQLLHFSSSNNILNLDIKGSITSECKNILEEFAESASNYTLCAVRYSRPIRACEYCVQYYSSVVEIHNKINSTCRNELINLDRLQIIESTHRNIQDVWNRGYCQKCFEWEEKNATISNNTEIFMSYYNIVNNCIETNINNSSTNKSDIICKDCMENYLNLNSFYESLIVTSETVGICMDIVDAMNSTREIWSKRLDCCKLRRTPEFIFLFCTAMITVLPVLFYLIAYYYCETMPLPVMFERRGTADLQGCTLNT